jgi:hypothetical protein
MAGETNDTPITTPSDQLSTSNPSGSTTGNTTVTGMPPDQQAQPQAQQPQAPQAPDQSQAPQAPQPGQQPQQAPAPTAQPAPPSRTQKFLSRAREISDEMAGGDPYKTQIDPNTGETTRTRQPLNPRAISMAIIFEALQGGLAGAGAHGPDAVGQAAQAGLKQGQQIADQRQEAQAKQDQEAQTDLRNRQQVVTNLLQTRLLAQSVGKQSMEQAQQSVAAWADRWKQHQEEPSSILGRDMSHESAITMLNKQPMGTAEIEITGVHPRTDEKGNLVYQNLNGQPVSEDTPGAYVAPDFDYAVVKANAKVRPVGPDGKLDAEHALAQKRNYTQYTGNADGTFPQDFTVDKMTDNAMLMQSRTASAVQKLVDTQRAAAHLPPLNIDDDLAQNSNVRNGLNAYMAALNTPGANYTDAYNAVLNAQGGKFANAAGTIQNWFGGKDHVATLNAGISAQDFNTAVKADPSILADPKNLQKALSSGDPVIKAAGVAQQKQNDQEAVHQETLKANAAASAHVWSEDAIADHKAKLALNGASPESAELLAQPATRNADGVLMHQAYFDSLPAKVKDQVRDIAYGDDAAPTTRTKESDAKNAMIHAAFPGFQASRFHTWQAVQKSATSGKLAEGFKNLNTAMDHAAELYDSSTALATLPLVSGIAGGLGNDAANKYHLAGIGFSEELGKAVKNGVLTQPQSDEMQNAIIGHNPLSARSKIRAALPLIKARIDEQQHIMDQANPVGVSPIQVFSKQAKDNYERLSGESGASPSTHPVTPASASQYSATTKDGKMGYIQGKGWITIPQ